MAENLMNSAHKSSTPESRKGYDQIKWDHEKCGTTCRDGEILLRHGAWVPCSCKKGQKEKS